MKAINTSDYINTKYGKLTIIAYDRYEKNYHFFIVKCDCKRGTVKSVRLSDLKSNTIKSCGLCKGDLRNDNKQLYSKWKNMKDRCFNVNNKEYNCYGQRGITVCDEWKNSFENFYQWSIENGYKTNLTIDRIDNDKSYSPDNCRFVTLSENVRKRNLGHNYHGYNHIVAFPNNDVPFIIKNVREFCKNFNLENRSVYKVCNGVYKTHRGWYFKYLEHLSDEENLLLKGQETIM